MTETRWKFLRDSNGSIKSDSGNQTWTIDEWETADGVVELCINGFHCSNKITQAFSYVQGEFVAKVEIRGDSDISSDKESWREMRLIDVRNWTNQDSVALAIYAAELVLGNFESEFPGDSRPRNAIKAARSWLNNSAESAARSAEVAAWAAAESAGAAARSAARSAEVAAWAAESAAWAAAWSARSAAESAAWSARSASEAAARSARSASEAAAELSNQLEQWMLERFETLTRMDA